MIFRSQIITHFTPPKSAIVMETDKPITQVVLSNKPMSIVI